MHQGQTLSCTLEKSFLGCCGSGAREPAAPKSRAGHAGQSAGWVRVQAEQHGITPPETPAPAAAPCSRAASPADNQRQTPAEEGGNPSAGLSLPPKPASSSGWGGRSPASPPRTCFPLEREDGGCPPCCAPSQGPAFCLRAAQQRVQRPPENRRYEVMLVLWRGSAAPGGAAVCGEAGEKGGETQLLAGGTLPPSWHLLIFLVTQVPLAVRCPAAREAAPVAGDQGTAAVTGHQPGEPQLR